ncbi:hypothetical protein Y032_0025g1148 [Ancylostoma ceylanicum]|uniref:Uncharacterized protein n=1 Tax=Ancylostoma ceylanicum TaxID=53326 RepID=A0A016UUH7_9BILA|nr:hypothetical protein Y032_0025g1148 [Ancylostoma ceylanicum]
MHDPSSSSYVFWIAFSEESTKRQAFEPTSVSKVDQSLSSTGFKSEKLAGTSSKPMKSEQLALHQFCTILTT